MERIKFINTERIIWSCDDYGITLHQLAEATGIAAGTIDRLLDGMDGLTFQQLRRIAKYFDRGVLFFLEQGGVDPAALYTPQFRTILNQIPDLDAKMRGLVQRVERQRETYLSLLEANSEEPTPFSPPAQLTPQEVRQWLQVAGENTFDAYRRKVEAKGILVFLTNGYAGKWQIPKSNPISGFSMYYEVAPVIVVKKESDHRQTFTLMHELGHVLLHRTSWIDESSDLYSYVGDEQEANAFAGQVLVTDAVVAAIDTGNRPDHVSDFDVWLEPTQNSIGVSVEVILRRLLDANELTQEEYRAYREWKEQAVFVETAGGNRAYRYREPMHMFGDAYVRTVLDAIHAGEITLTKASNYLDSIKVTAIHELEQYAHAHV